MLVLTDLDDAALLERIAVNPSAAQDEIEVFYTRHVRYLFAVVSRQCSGFGLAQHETEDLVQDTFQRAFDRASTFRSPESNHPDERRRWTRAWLGRIARNLLLDLLRGRQETPLGDAMVSLEATPLNESPVSEGTSAINPRLAALEAALADLSEREQDVLRISALHHRAGEQHQRLPNEVSQELARRWNTTNENIRAIRSRAMKKLATRARQILEKEASHDSAQA